MVQQPCYVCQWYSRVCIWKGGLKGLLKPGITNDSAATNNVGVAAYNKAVNIHPSDLEVLLLFSCTEKQSPT